MMNTDNESRFDPDLRFDVKSAGIRCGAGESVCGRRTGRGRNRMKFPSRCRSAFHRGKPERLRANPGYTIYKQGFRSRPHRCTVPENERNFAGKFSESRWMPLYVLAAKAGIRKEQPWIPARGPLGPG